MRKILSKQSMCVFVIVLLCALQLVATDFRTVVLDPTYDHDRWGTSPQDIVRQFRAYTVSFDSKDNDVAMGVPEWVAHEIKPISQTLPAGPARPSAWISLVNFT